MVVQPTPLEWGLSSCWCHYILPNAAFTHMRITFCWSMSSGTSTTWNRWADGHSFRAFCRFLKQRFQTKVPPCERNIYMYLKYSETNDTECTAMPQIDLAKHSGHWVTIKHWPICGMFEMQLCSTRALHSSRILSDTPRCWTAWV